MTNKNDEYKNDEQKICVVGMGYVGYPLALLLASEYAVVGYDIDVGKIKRLKNGEDVFDHIADRSNNTKILFTSSPGDISDCNVYILCLPTPLNEDKDPDLSYLENGLYSITPYLTPGDTLIIESTVYPGATRELAQNLDLPEGINLCYSPEREDPGNAFGMRDIPKIVSGKNLKSLSVIMDLYGKVFSEIVPTQSIKTAETAKLLENIYRAVNISLVNELKMVCDKLDINIWDVIDLAKTKPFGFTAFYPGPGVGGHCIPVDFAYLLYVARRANTTSKFLEHAGEVNLRMPQYVVDQTMRTLNRQRLPVSGSKILILGVSYKKNLGDIRESPALTIMEQLDDLGAYVYYYDEYISDEIADELSTYKRLTSSSYVNFVKYYADCVVVVTDHANVDYGAITRHAKALVDTRGVSER